MKPKCMHTVKGPLTIYDIHKIVKTRRRLRQVRYASVNKRVRILQESGYIKKTGVRKTEAGSEACIYELTARAYLAVLLSQISLDRFIEEAEDRKRRCCYTIVADREGFKVIVLEVFPDHKSYNRRFGYRKG